MKELVLKMPINAFSCNVLPMISSSIVISMNWQPADSLHLHKRFFFSLATTKIILSRLNRSQKYVSRAKRFTQNCKIGILFSQTCVLQ